MIDNHPDAYPQTGLDHALVVFEALAEFGITRFMAVYAPGIGPDAPAGSRGAALPASGSGPLGSAGGGVRSASSSSSSRRVDGRPRLRAAGG